KTHAVPLTIDEFMTAQRFYPIVFSSGENPVPLALMGLNEGINTVLDTEGKLIGEPYIPAYARRYPFLLAKLREDAQELSLCFDPTAEAIGLFDDGDALFEPAGEGGERKPTQIVTDILKFCEEFEQSGARTTAFVGELVEHKLLMEGEISIQADGIEAPFIYRGFQMVNEEVLRDLRGDVLRKMMQSGLLPLVFAHLFSLALARDIFSKQVAQGKMELPKAA
ncbi:MAG: SapC family protein, partial [Alphaproteobacteria bacterium]|nr:SapC family protein [Alphaproteobacteria bacterium]